MPNRVTCGVFPFINVGPGDHALYNWWHSYEHMPEFQTLSNEVQAQRYVTTPDLMPFRSCSDPALAAAQYLGTYYHQGVPERSLKERAAHNASLVANAPKFTGQRTTPFTGAFDFVQGSVAARLRITPEALLYRPHTGVHVAMVDLKDPGAAKAAEEWYEKVQFPDVLRIKGFAGVWAFISRRHPDFRNPPGRLFHLYLLDEDPVAALSDMQAKMPGWTKSHERFGSLVISSPYRTIVEGPDQKYDWFDR